MKTVLPRTRGRATPGARARDDARRARKVERRRDTGGPERRNGHGRVDRGLCARDGQRVASLSPPPKREEEIRAKRGKGSAPRPSRPSTTCLEETVGGASQRVMEGGEGEEGGEGGEG